MADEQPDTLESTAQLLEENKDFPGKHISPIFFNQFYVVVGPTTSRLTLGEYVFSGQEPNWTSTLVFTTDVAIDLARKILGLAKAQGLIGDESMENGPSE